MTTQPSATPKPECCTASEWAEVQSSAAHAQQDDANKPSATPRTDKEAMQVGPDAPLTQVVWASFARALETELAAAKSTLEIAVPALERRSEQLAAARAECERLTEAMFGYARQLRPDLDIPKDRKASGHYALGLLTAELARLRAEKSDAEKSIAIMAENLAEAARQIAASDSLYRATCTERDRLRAENERLKDNATIECERANGLGASAERAEAQLAQLKDTIEQVCTGGRLTCDDCQQAKPCMCEHKP